MSIRTTKKILAQVNKLKAEISKKRDTLRDIISELEQLDGNCENALAHLDRAADDLSELL